MLFKAIGQTMNPLPKTNGSSELPEMQGERIAVGPDRRSSLPDVWAGRDCVSISEDLTVAAVQDGKLAAEAIDAWLRGGAGSGVTAFITLTPDQLFHDTPRPPSRHRVTGRKRSMWRSRAS